MSLLNRVSNAAIKSAISHWAHFDQQGKRLSLNKNLIATLSKFAVSRSSMFQSLDLSVHEDFVDVRFSTAQCPELRIHLTPLYLTFAQDQIIFEGQVVEQGLPPLRVERNEAVLTIEEEEVRFFSVLRSSAFLTKLETLGIKLRNKRIPLGVNQEDLVFDLQDAVMPSYRFDVQSLVRAFS